MEFNDFFSFLGSWDDLHLSDVNISTAIEQFQRQNAARSERRERDWMSFDCRVNIRRNLFFNNSTIKNT